MQYFDIPPQTVVNKQWRYIATVECSSSTGNALYGNSLYDTKYYLLKISRAIRSVKLCNMKQRDEQFSD
jgi:hypothetical protein